MTTTQKAALVPPGLIAAAGTANGEAEPSAHTQARILAEALPNMLRYDEQTVIVKFGGHAMGDAALATAFAQDVVYLKQSGVNLIVVHGGGPQIAEMLKKLEIKSEFVNGLRVTDKRTVEVVEMVLAGLINKDIVSAINRQGGKAVGISGKDANLMIARKITEMPDPELEPDAGGRHRLRRRAGRGQPAHRRRDLEIGSHPRHRADRPRPRRADPQHQRRHVRLRARRAHEGQAPAAAHRRGGRARQGRSADRGAVDRWRPPISSATARSRAA